MKILIAYASRHGATKECGERLAKELSAHEVDRVDLEKETPDPEKYDFIALGSYIRGGKVNPKVRKFAEKLPGKKYGLFLCCGYTDSSDDYYAKNFGAEIRKNAVQCACFGGDLNPDKHKGFDKLVVRMIRGTIEEYSEPDEIRSCANMPCINPESISRFADAVRSSFGKNFRGRNRAFPEKKEKAPTK